MLAQVRRDAHECGLREIFFSSDSKVVSFAAGSRSAGFRRLNVWWCVGMVGVCVDHPTQGSTQLLRRSVDQEALRRLMRQPRPLRRHAPPQQRRASERWYACGSSGRGQ